jgi:hypothetical protein
MRLCASSCGEVGLDLCFIVDDPCLRNFKTPVSQLRAPSQSLKKNEIILIELRVQSMRTAGSNIHAPLDVL